MKSFVLTGIRQMACREVATPEIRRDTDVLLRIRAVGVCGSDVHYYTTGRIGVQVVQYPFAVGHECAATVEKVGAGVTRLKPGDRVAVEPAMPCHGCDQCLAGRPHTCRNLSFLGCPGQAEGCLSEFLVMPQDCCFPVPDSVPLESAALVEPLSIGCYAARLGGGLPRGARVGILGCGPIGLSVLAALQAGNRKPRVYATDKIPARLDNVRRAGALWAGNPGEEDVAATVTAREPLGLDVVFECCGQQDALDLAVQMMKPGGRIVLVGIPEVDRVSFAIDVMRRKEICLQNVRRQNHCVEPALEIVARRKVNVAGMITHRFPFERTKEAFDLVAGYGDNVIKAMVILA